MGYNGMIQIRGCQRGRGLKKVAEGLLEKTLGGRTNLAKVGI
jgi:hypothetical protein